MSAAPCSDEPAVFEFRGMGPASIGPPQNMKYRTLFGIGTLALLATAMACSDNEPSPPSSPDGTGGSNEASGGETASSVEEAGFDPTADVEVRGHIFEPEQLEPLDVSELTVPDGFVVTKVAENLGNARMIVVAEDGTVYLTRRQQGDVLMLKDTGEGAFTAPVPVAARPGLHGLALHDGKAYLATAHEVFRGDVLEDGTFGPLEMIIHDLPAAGQHNTRTVAVGPDEMLYISVGSTCNRCDESNPENASLLRGSSTASSARSGQPDCGTRSAGAGTPKPASSGAWTTASTGSETAFPPKS